MGLHVLRVAADVGDQEQRTPRLLHARDATSARPMLRVLRSDATYSRVAELPLQIERCELLPLVRDTSSGFTKVSTVVRLTGNGHEGQGEDITWDQIDQIEQFRAAGELSWLRRGAPWMNSTLLGLVDLFRSGRSATAPASPLGVRERRARPRLP